MNDLDKIEMPGMLLIGAAARGSGKTALATAVTSRFARDAGVTAAKVTVLDPAEGGCLHGGHGGERCSPLSEGFCITEEEDREGTKDTSRLLAAGARKVLWLQSLKARLQDGALRLRELSGAGSPWICESNSLRQVVRPDVFLMVRESQAKCFKPSAEAVRSYADMVISFDPANFEFDFDLSRLALIGGRWTLRLPARVDTGQSA